jgi:hypothetical protein
MVKQASRKITVRFPEHKYSFVIELLENLEFVEIQEIDTLTAKAHYACA